ncbi:MAG TPA: Fic family protein [Baekduia sp.]|uniref:Fic family protein n=1 Tax=Baekduia sp. TaxID=2600305 RepID=UPI002D78A23F|nr:Fic family protein [Baekduia sp.]HET6509745.1 Fic family protein [Baekduia sp.]
MPELIKLRWLPAATSGLPRRELRGCDYEAYVPDPLVGRDLVFAGETIADVSDAERAVARLNLEATTLVDSEAAARLLLRAEAVASSHIEGLQVGGRRLFKAQLALGVGHEPGDVTAVEILNNVEAMRWAVAALDAGEAIEVAHLLEIHRRLVAGTALEAHGGRVREEQNWIGGNSYNPCAAAFVPPPPERVPELLADLCAFCNDDLLPPLVQAAIAHAQFETIHPFVDGNGRTGRALIHVILRRRGLAPSVVPPVSLVLAARSRDYVNGLMGTRDADPRAVDRGLDAWVATFAAATTQAVSDAMEHERRVAELQARWRAELAPVRAGSAVARLVDALPGAPVLTVRSAAELTGRSVQAINEAIARLVAAGVLVQTTIGKRNRGFEAPDLIRLLSELEWRLSHLE